MREERAPAVRVEGLTKRFGDVLALREVDLTVPRGSVVGLLGPNGAGKTTAVHVLATLLHPDGGLAEVDGIDVVTNPVAVRHVIGLAGQFAAIDEVLTGRENLELLGGLWHLPAAKVRSRATELLERFGLSDAGDRPVRTYSGGMRRRLDLAASLVGNPRVVFLDEPTTGLDPRSRFALWDIIRELVRGGASILLTTQYLEEADQLADEIVVLDHGQVVAAGTGEELKRKVGNDLVEFGVVDDRQTSVALAAVAPLATTPPTISEERIISVPVGDDGSDALVETVRRLDAVNVRIRDLTLRKPSLDDVFLALTGHAAESNESDDRDGDQP